MNFILRTKYKTPFPYSPPPPHTHREISARAQPESLPVRLRLFGGEATRKKMYTLYVPWNVYVISNIKLFTVSVVVNTAYNKLSAWLIFENSTLHVTCTNQTFLLVTYYIYTSYLHIK